MPNPAYSKRKIDKPFYEGPRSASWVDLDDLTDNQRLKVQLIIDAMDWPQYVFFRYDGKDRSVAPFVVGVSSEGNPLLRGYQVEGESRSGKGWGWRVFQVNKIEDLEICNEYFRKEEFEFDQLYPWIYRVFKTL